MEMNSYQDAARKTAAYPDVGRNPIYPTLGLTGEAGEVADKVKKVIRDRGGVFDADLRSDQVGAGRCALVRGSAGQRTGL